MHVQITAGKALQRSFSEKLETSLSLSVLPKSSWQTLICTLWEIKLSWQVSVGSAHYWRAVCIRLRLALVSTSLCLWKTVFISTCSSSLRVADALREPRSRHAALWVIIPGNRPQTACRCHGAVAQVSAASPEQERNRFGGGVGAVVVWDGAVVLQSVWMLSRLSARPHHHSLSGTLSC